MDSRIYAYALWRALLCLWLAAAVHLAVANPIKARNRLQSARQATSPPRLVCADPGIPNNGYRVGNHRTFYDGQQVNFECLPGYELEGAKRISCIAYHHDGDKQPAAVRWDADLPHCLPISPQAHNTVRQQLKRQSTDSLPCSDYDDISFGHRNITGTLPGDTVTFGCDEGFELLGSPELTCETNGNWSGAWPMCVRGTCPKLRAPKNGSVRAFSNHPGSFAKYFCNSGYVLWGNVYRKCLDDGSWSGSMPTCRAGGSCGTLEDPENGVVSYAGTPNNSQAIYQCNHGYYLTGDGLRTCLDSIWTGSTPTCIPIRCPLLTVPANTNLSMTNSNFVFSTATYTCREGYGMSGGQSVRVCQPSGIWTGKPPGCYALDCGTPEGIHHGTVSYLNTLQGSEATYKCDEAYELSLGDMIRTCLSNREWSGTPPCCIRKFNAIDCNPLRYPTNGHLSLTNGLQLDSVATYSCDKGYELVGGDKTRVCSDVGWTGFEPTCKPNCEEPQSPENGEVFFTDTSSGSVAAYNCSQGYMLSGPSTRECQPSGEWTGIDPSCPLTDSEEENDENNDELIVVAAVVVVILLVAGLAGVTVAVGIVVYRCRHAEPSLQPHAHNPQIITIECAAYGAPTSSPPEEIPQLPDYEVVTRENIAYAPTQSGQGDTLTSHGIDDYGYEIVF